MELQIPLMDKNFSALFEHNTKELREIIAQIQEVDYDNKRGHVETLNLSNLITQTNRTIESLEKNKCSIEELFKLEDKCASYYVSKMEYN